MRPHELDVTVRLDEVVVARTEDDADEPYLWVLGFAVDADTIDAPPAGSLIPTIRVRTVAGAPSFPWLVGAGDVEAPATLAIPPALGTRVVRLRPELLDAVGWFDGLAGVVVLLWDQDAFSPATSEAGHAAFERAFAPALAAELRTLLEGDAGYDAALNRGADGAPLPLTPETFSLPWRMARLGDPAALGHAVRELTSRVTSAIRGPVRDALAGAAGWDELLDPDDLLGADAAVLTGRQLAAGPSPITLRFTDDGADYTIRGEARASRVRRHHLTSVVTAATSAFAGSSEVRARVCWFAERAYVATATRTTSTTRVELRTTAGGPPAQVRWLLDDVPLDGGSGTRAVTLRPASAMTGSPAKPLAETFPGGPGTIAWAAGPTWLDLTTVAGDGVWESRVRAVVAYHGDPTLTPPFALTPQQLRDRGYEAELELAVVTLQVRMDQAYVDDLARCLRTVTWVDAKRIPLLLDPRVDPGDPQPDWATLLDVAGQQEQLVALTEGRRDGGPVDVVDDVQDAVRTLARAGVLSPREQAGITRRLRVR